MKEVNAMEPSSTSTLYRIVARKYRTGQAKIAVDRGLSLLSYSKFTRNPLLKLFHFIVVVYSFPLTVLCAIGFLFLREQYLFIAFYLMGLFLLIASEITILRRITINSAMNDEGVFNDLYRKGVIRIR